MISLLIISPYYNNSHFIDLQIRSFRKYLKECTWKLLVVDDSNMNTINCLTKEKEDILNICNRYHNEVEYIKFSDSNYNISSIKKHRNVLNFIMRNLSKMYMNSYDYLFSLDADMCFIKEFNCKTELEGFDIIGPKRIQSLNNQQLSPDGLVFEYFWVHCCFFNLKTIRNLETINFDEIPHTNADTGSMMIEFLYNNPQYNLKYFNFSDGRSLKTFYGFDTFYNNTFLHFGAGSLWHNQKESIYPELFNIFKDKIVNGLTNMDYQIIEEEYIKVVYPQHIKFFERTRVTKNDLIDFGLNIN